MSPLPLIALAKIATPFIVRTALPYISRVAIPAVARNVNKIAPVIEKNVVQLVTKGKDAMVTATNLAKNNISAVSAHARNQGNAILSTVKSSAQSNLDKVAMGARLAKDAAINATSKQIVGAGVKGYGVFTTFSILSGNQLSEGEKILKDRLSAVGRETDKLKDAFEENRLVEYLSSVPDRIGETDAEDVKNMLQNNATLLDIASIIPIRYMPYNITMTAASILNCNALAASKFYTGELTPAGLAKEVAVCVGEPLAVNKATTFSSSATQ
ncbi:MAG: hypothetical protein KFW09_01680 [Oscillospiraceae bacterium]|nr:hypothetical protein [Oscillospiraceae bacterium]